MSAPQVVLGRVGSGRHAERGYLPAVAATPSVRLVAVTDANPARRVEVAALAGATAVPDIRALTASGIDGLIVATPAAAHLADATVAAVAGLPALVEKPPAPDAEGALALAHLQPPPWIAFNRRFDPGVRAARAAVPPRGELHLLVELTYRRRAWGAIAVHDDALLDLGPHVVDLARWLTGSEVLAVTAARVEPERAELTLVLDRAQAQVRVATNRPHRERIVIRDGRGRVVARHERGGLRGSVRAKLDGAAGPSALVVSLAGQLAAFASAIRGAPDPTLGTVADGLAVMDVIHAARASGASGGRATAVALRAPA
jgi:predicted dehydrogenase